MKTGAVFPTHGPPRFYIDGRQVTKRQWDAHTRKRVKEGLVHYGGAPMTQQPSCWPMASDACGVHPVQIPDQRDEMHKHGVHADHTPDGRVIFNSARHRKKVCEALGYYDRNGGYSDPQRK